MRHNLIGSLKALRALSALIVQSSQEQPASWLSGRELLAHQEPHDTRHSVGDRSGRRENPPLIRNGWPPFLRSIPVLSSSRKVFRMETVSIVEVLDHSATFQSSWSFFDILAHVIFLHSWPCKRWEMQNKIWHFHYQYTNRLSCRFIFPNISIFPCIFLQKWKQCFSFLKTY